MHQAKGLSLCRCFLLVILLSTPPTQYHRFNTCTLFLRLARLPVYHMSSTDGKPFQALDGLLCEPFMVFRRLARLIVSMCLPQSVSRYSTSLSSCFVPYFPVSQSYVMLIIFHVLQASPRTIASHTHSISAGGLSSAPRLDW